MPVPPVVITVMHWASAVPGGVTAVGPVSGTTADGAGVSAVRTS
ncbi:hypothetical protein ACWCXH_23735 [Kitasatospora sp. NPDC001660]